VSLQELARQWLEPTNASWDSTARVWRFPSGASLDFGHERYLYVAGEYHMVGCDDLTAFSDTEYRRLFQVWRRRQGSTTPMRVRVATSPGGPGHDWVRERFAIDNPQSVLPLGRRVLFAQMSDNEHLDVEEYRRSLANLDPVRRAQLETGDWSIRQGGAIFQRQWFRIVDRAPAGLRRVRFWDLAATAEPTRTDLLYDPDYTVGALLGHAHDGTVYVLDVIRRRLDSPDVKRLVRQTAELDGREVVIGMEQESGASGKAVISDYRRILAGYVFQPRQPFADKVTRAAPYASYAEGGGVRLVRAPWNAAFLQEHEQFPLGEHDDVVDAAGWGFFLLVGKTTAANGRDRARAHFNPWATEDVEP
jgi:predicted phage terminase large subunit-like protein